MEGWRGRVLGLCSWSASYRLRRKIRSFLMLSFPEVCTGRGQTYTPGRSSPQWTPRSWVQFSIIVMHIYPLYMQVIRRAFMADKSVNAPMKDANRHVYCSFETISTSDIGWLYLHAYVDGAPRLIPLSTHSAMFSVGWCSTPIYFDRKSARREWGCKIRVTA